MNAEGGRLVGARRVRESAAGFEQLRELVAQHEPDASQVVVGIETDHGLWVAALVSAGYQVYAINPLAASRYRDRHRVSGAKSDAADAKMLADLVRTDKHNHQPLAADTPEVNAIQTRARTHEALVADSTAKANELRAAVGNHFPAALTAFDKVTDIDAAAVLEIVSSPTQAASADLDAVEAALRAAGRTRKVADRARNIVTRLRAAGGLTAPAAEEAAWAARTRVLAAQLKLLNVQTAEAAKELEDFFGRHPHADTYRSMPGFGSVTAPRVLGEFGDDPGRFADAKSRKNYAGTSPLTQASGKKRLVTARFIRNNHLYNALDAASFSALSTSPGARAFYDWRRREGDLHHQALRVVANRLVGILHGCLKTGTLYDEDKAWGHRNDTSRGLTPAAA
jgi:transposase